MRRFLPTLAGALVALVVLGIAGVGESGGIVGPVVLLLPLGGGVAWLVSRRGPRGDQTWERGAPVDFVPAAAHEPGVGRDVALALARVECRELLASGSFGAGLGFAALVVLLFGFAWSADYGGDLPAFTDLLALLVHPLVGFTVLAAFRARTRGRRDGAEEIFTTCPTGEDLRSVGHLGSGVVAALAATITAGATLVAVVSRASVTYGAFGSREVANLVVPAVLGLGGVALGVALARVTPWTIVPVAAVIGIGFATANLATTGTRETEPARQLSLWLGDLELDRRFSAPHWAGHVGWIVGLTVLVGLLAVLVDRRPPAIVAAAVAVAVATIGSGWAATRPIAPASAEEIAALLADPRAAQTCDEVGPISVCTFPGEADLRERYVAEVAPVVAAVPAGLEPLTIRYGAEVATEDLDPAVLALLPEPVAEPGLVPLEMTGHRAAYEAARLWVALEATGIAEDSRPGAPAEVRGQARGVLALWLATRGAGDGARRGLTSFAEHPEEGSPGNRPWPDPCVAGPAPAIWAASDVAAARSLTELPDDVVEAVVAERWDRLVDPATTTDDLLADAGLPPLGEPRGRTRIPSC